MKTVSEIINSHDAREPLENLVRRALVEGFRIGCDEISTKACEISDANKNRHEEFLYGVNAVIIAALDLMHSKTPDSFL